MNHLFYKFFILIISLFFVNTAFAEEMLVGTHKNQIPVQIKLRNGELKSVSLLKVSTPKLTQSLKPMRMFFSLARHDGLESASSLPVMVDLGMNSVPVLDQGPWGTCATFATVAAIDAYYPLKGKETVSELCNLALGKTLQEVSGTDGGWNGSFGNVILKQINQYGYLPHSYQEEYGCGGLKEYPDHSAENNGSGMPVELFTQNSIKKFTENDWKALPAVYSRDDAGNGSWHGNNTLKAVRQSLAEGHRVTFGVILDSAAENVGITGKYNGITDVFVLTEDIMTDIMAGMAAGHAMVIIGYNDNACATYTYTDKTTGNKSQKLQCGLLKLRNSWGTFAGDKGDFYMTYDYFKYLTMESFSIGAK